MTAAQFKKLLLVRKTEHKRNIHNTVGKGACWLTGFSIKIFERRGV
jgi:hypothetical protein